MAKKKFVIEEDIALDPQLDGQQEIIDTEMNTQGIHSAAVERPKRIEPPKAEPKEKPEYLYLDVSGMKNYLDVMSKAKYGKGNSMTKYVQELIQADMELNKSKYEAEVKKQFGL